MSDLTTFLWFLLIVCALGAVVVGLDKFWGWHETRVRARAARAAEARAARIRRTRIFDQMEAEPYGFNKRRPRDLKSPGA